MSISDALSYPFRSNNLYKILPIAIIYGIIAFLTSYASVNNSMFLVCGASIALLVFSFVLGGYYVSVIGQVHKGDEPLEQINLSRDFPRGLATWLAGILYMLPLVVFGCVAAVLPAMLTSANDSGPGLSLLVLLIALVVVVPLTIFLGLALLVGYNRYAVEGTTSALYALGDNFGLAWNHAGQGLGFIVRSIVIGFVNFVVVLILQVAIGLAFPQQVAFGARPTTIYWIGFALIQVFTYAVSLIFIVSQYHLVARYGIALGITREKQKSGATPAGGMNAWIIVALVLGVLFFMGVAVVVVLTLLGPSVGEIFSDINRELMMTAQPR